MTMTSMVTGYIDSAFSDRVRTNKKMVWRLLGASLLGTIGKPSYPSIRADGS